MAEYIKKQELLNDTRVYKDDNDAVRRGKWEILEDYKDGTSRCRCTSCKNTYRLSKQTIYGFSFCPRCGSYNREYDGYKSNKWIGEIRIASNEQIPPADVVEREKIDKVIEEIENINDTVHDGTNHFYKTAEDIKTEVIDIINEYLGE